MTFYARHLPHWQPLDRSIFVTWRLHGSLPIQVVDRLSRQQRSSSGKYFLDIDRLLDRARTGVAWLNDPRIAERVMAAIQRGEANLGHYVLQAFDIMPNHVHLLVRPCVPIDRITKGLKGTTAREANSILDRTGHHSGRTNRSITGCETANSSTGSECTSKIIR
jgi:putative transposase